MPSAFDLREQFHVLLLAHLPLDLMAVGERTPPALRLKGGMNLRLLHGSPRYSEDMDFDVLPARSASVARRVRQTLESAAFRRALQRIGIDDVRLSPLDAGESGWKQKLRLQAGGVWYATKIEASTRTPTGAVEVRVVATPGGQAPGVARVAGTPCVAALAQKVVALAERQVPQPRDVFDAHLLLAQLPPADRETAARESAATLGAETLAAARDVVLALDESRYRSETVAYLDAAAQAVWADAWDDLRRVVWTWLEEAIAHAVTPAPRTAAAPARSNVPPEDRLA